MDSQELAPIHAVLRAELTADQYAAATDPNDEALCLAPAGSGKSRTLAYRIARLVAEGEPPDSIVAFTFTNKAAESIKLRVSQALQKACLDSSALGAMYIGTIDSYCQYLLGEIDPVYRQFDVIDMNGLKLFLMSRSGDLGLRPLTGRAKRRPYFETISKVADAWTTMNNELIDAADVSRYDAELGNVLHRLYARLESDQFIDFSFAVRMVVEALQDSHSGAARAVGKLRHLMVDEYQDVNPLQEALIRVLHSKSKSLFTVADDDQAIYGWRGADVSNVLEFEERHPGCSVLRLTTNFRSTPAIVAAADNFAAQFLGANRMPKDTQAADRPGPRDFRTLWFEERTQEAEWIAQRIRLLLGTKYTEQDGTRRGLTPGDFANLMRSTRTPEQDSFPRHTAFTKALHGAGIPYVLEAGGGVFDTPEVDVLRQAFRLLRNGSPHRPDVDTFFRTVVLPCYPTGDVRAVRATFAEWGRAIHAPITGSRRRIYPQGLVQDLLAAFGIAQREPDAAVMRNLGVFSRIVKDVETVFPSVDSTSRFQSIVNFLDNEAALGYDAAASDHILQRPDAVTIATVHKAKGLEYPVVFVADVESQRFPGNRRNYSGWLPQPVMFEALARGAYQSTLEEETRLFYTAITRAERFLYVSGSELLPEGKPRTRSVFAQSLEGPEVSHDRDGLPDGLEPYPQARRIDETMVPTTFSEIRYFLACPKDYQFRRMFGFTPPVAETFGFGQSVHTSIEKMHHEFPGAAPSPEQAEAVADRIFHLKHVPPSQDPANRPGVYERGQALNREIAKRYVEQYKEDFERKRQVEARFEIPAQNSVISGAIDLLVEYDTNENVTEAEVIDFKTNKTDADPVLDARLHWTDLALQVQLYARGAQQVLKQNAGIGSVHLLRAGMRVGVPVDPDAVAAAVSNVEWAVRRIIGNDFPMRPKFGRKEDGGKCEACDFRKLCSKRPQRFTVADEPPAIHVPAPTDRKMARAFSEFDEVQP